MSLSVQMKIVAQGDRKLIRMFKSLTGKEQKKAWGSALGKSRTRTKKAVRNKVQRFFSGAGQKRETIDFGGARTEGRTRKARTTEITMTIAEMVRSGVNRSRTTADGLMRGWAQPKEAGDAIKFNSVEYGHIQRGAIKGPPVGPRPFVRSTIDGMRRTEFGKIAKDIGSWIERQAKKKGPRRR